MRPRYIVAALALAFFFVPVGLRVVGVTAKPFENRPLATFPKASQGWKALDQGTQFLVDRLPLREQAVRANTWASEHVFKTPPENAQTAAKGALPFEKPAQKAAANRQGPGQAVPAQGQPGITILVGKDGWLYLEEELKRTCTLFASWDVVLQRWQQMTRIIRASGRRVVLLIPPDKSTIYPEHLPDSYAERDCAPDGRKKAWAAIEGASDPAVLGLRQTLLRAKTTFGGTLYLHKDTHWNTAGGTLGVRALMEKLGGPPVRDQEIVKTTVPYTGDLTNLMGAPQQDRTPAWTIQRPGLGPPAQSTATWADGGTGPRLRHPAGGPPMLEGRTVFIDDSFGIGMQDALSAYTRDLSILLWYGGQPPSATIDAIKHADTVILETAERDLNYKASDPGIVTPTFLADLARALGVKP